MAPSWYVDEGLDKLIDEWKAEHPGAVVGTIGDLNHSTNPRSSQHAPDDGKSGGAGDDKGEVDGGDFMPGHGVTEGDLDDLAENLRKSRDPRLLIVIRRNRIFSSIVQPFVWRPYSGKYHGHTHVSVNDRYNNNRADWKWEDEVARTYKMVEVPGKFPELQTGDEDQDGKVQHIRRIQGIANSTFGADLDVDGVYGANTAAFVKKMMKDDDARSSTNGSKFHLPEIKRCFGIW
jgi:hypothetical protein